MPFQERKIAAKMKLSQMEAELSAASDQLKALKESERSRKAMSVRSGDKSHLQMLLLVAILDSFWNL